MAINSKRDRIQIIAEILVLCKTPQTQTRIRRQTGISYEVLQDCIVQLLTRQWLLHVAEGGQRKLAVTDKGQVFLDKWVELQLLAGSKNKTVPAALPPVKAAYCQ